MKPLSKSLNAELDAHRAKLLEAGRETLKARLCSREQVVIAGVFAGKTNAAIAAELGTTVQCVKNQLRFAYRKLGVRSRNDLVWKSITEGGYQLWTYRGEKYRKTVPRRFETAAEKQAAIEAERAARREGWAKFKERMRDE